jgi:phage I-like protein
MKKTVTHLSTKALAVHAVALTAVDASAVEGAAGNWIMLMPAGVFSGRTGRGPFDTGGVAEMTAIIERTLQRAGGTEIVVDYDHQTIFAAIPGVGGTARAAGWIKEFDIRDDGLWGRVEWTANAASAIRAGEYRYISPTFYAPKETGKVLLLLSAALTNTPDLDLAVVAASALLPTETETTDMKSIAKALGLPEDASEAEILIAMNAVLSTNSALVAASGAAKPEDAIATITTMRSSTGKVDPALYVQADITALQATVATDKAETDVSQAIADGKIQPALKDWAIDLHKSNITAFNAFLAKAPVLTMSQRATIIPPNAGEAVLDDADLLVMSQMGISREDMLKAKKNQEARN